MKSIILTFLVLLPFTIYVKAQNTDKTVTISVSSSGKTQEEAKQSALRSAIEQAFGAFISSKTELFNDQVVADQMSSVSSGNIKSYEVLNESQLPNGNWGVTLKALVSVDKLTSFVETKGIAIEIKGGLFALNIKQQLLNEQGEIKAVSEMVGLLHEPMQVSFNYIIKSNDPKSLDSESENWEIPLVVTAITNKNIDFCANYFIKNLAALSLSAEEVTSYKALNKIVFPISINYNGVNRKFYLRKKRSIQILHTLASQWEFYTRLFKVESGLDESNGNGDVNIHVFAFTNENKDLVSINFLTSDQKAATFSWQDKRTLAEIEKLSGYKVKPRGVVSQFKYGGFVVYEKDGHGLVAAITDLDKMEWDKAIIACDELVLNGYNDWHLPTMKELSFLYTELKLYKIGGLLNDQYWSSKENNNEDAWTLKYFDWEKDKEYYSSKLDTYGVRPVRTF
jgi:hypothetical protein